MKYASALIHTCLALTGLYLTWHYITQYYPADPLGYEPPLVVWVLDTISLFIHEAGHLLFSIFGQTTSILGGSLLQCLLPLALTIVTWREKPHQAGYPLFWLGGNLVNVSVYVADAPDKNLRLIKDGLIHDWNWLLASNLELATPLATVLRGTGILLCAAGVALVVYYTMKSVNSA